MLENIFPYALLVCGIAVCILAWPKMRKKFIWPRQQTKLFPKFNFYSGQDELIDGGGQNLNILIAGIIIIVISILLILA